MQNYIKPNWPAPKNIIAYTTTRLHEQGKSKPPYNNFNLAMHVDDNLNDVLQNRAILAKDLHLPNNPCWLKQEHTIDTVKIEKFSEWSDPIADASYTLENNLISAVLTADCLPILITDTEGSLVSAIHAGWKGLVAGIIEAAIKALPVQAKNLIAWMGPAIGPAAFVVGEEVKQQFISFDKTAKIAFKSTVEPNKFWCNIYLLGKQRLNSVGVHNIYGGEFCTYSDPQKFYSFRRDGVTGRIATLIYKNE